VAERVPPLEERTGRVPTIFVTDREEFLGELPGTALSVADPETERITDHLRETPSVRYDRADEEVLAVFRQKRADRTVAVLDEDGDILGVIHARDLLQLIDEAAGETLYEFTGVAEESVLDGAVKIRRRYKWLILNLATAFMAAAVVGLFESTIAAVAILAAAYMPVVAGGERGHAVDGGHRPGHLARTGVAVDRETLIANEAIAGAANGLITGALVAVIATAFSYGAFGILLGAVIGVSMVANLVIAGFFGALHPSSSTSSGTIRRPQRPSSSRPRPTCWASSSSSDWPGGVDLSVLGGSLQPGQEPDRRVPSRPAS